MVLAPASPTEASAARARRDASAALAAVQQRQLDILQRRGARQQVEALEDEAEVTAAQPGALVAVQLLHRTPRNRYSPLVGVSRQPRMFMAVDLPEPLGPITATNSPGMMRRLTPRSAWKAACPGRRSW
jgi:hypothetical protein